jgi:hypothetical protein
MGYSCIAGLIQKLCIYVPYSYLKSLTNGVGSIRSRSMECVELYLHSTIHHGVIIKHRGNFTFTVTLQRALNE